MSRALTFLGKVSYSGYLFHWITMVQLKGVMGSSIATVLVGIVFSIVIAFIANKVIEMPIYRIRKVLLTEVAGSLNKPISGESSTVDASTGR